MGIHGIKTAIVQTEDGRNHRLRANYPDHDQWRRAHDVAFTKLGDENVIDWRTDIPINTHPLPLAISYLYKCSSDGNTFQRNARGAVRGNIMKPCIHFDS